MRIKLFGYGAAVTTLKFFEILPRPVGYALARALAAACYRVDRRHCDIGRVNLRIAFPEKSDLWRETILKNSYLNLGTMLVEVSKFPRLSAAGIARRITYTEGSLERYHKAKQKNSGLLFITAHVGAWELLPFAHALNGYRLSFVVRPIDDARMDKLLQRYRTGSGNRVLPKKNAVRAILRALQENKDVGILYDQNVLPGEGVFVPLFGKEACTTNGVAMIALRTGAPVLPGFILPTGRQGHYRIHFGEEIPLFTAGSLEENIRRSSERFNQVLEEIVRRYPDQWLWLHKRWKTRPVGETEPLYT